MFALDVSVLIYGMLYLFMLSFPVKSSFFINSSISGAV